MQKPQPKSANEYDLLVIGSGAGGLSTAITARKKGLNVIVIEKEGGYKRHCRGCAHVSAERNW
jgi:flavin-dependent dehydrogenase